MVGQGTPCRTALNGGSELLIFVVLRVSDRPQHLAGLESWTRAVRARHKITAGGALRRD
jgi:hypothetical protein